MHSGALILLKSKKHRFTGKNGVFVVTAANAFSNLEFSFNGLRVS